MASGQWRHWGYCPGWYHPWGDIKLIFCGWICKEHWTNDVGGEGGSGDYETTAKTGRRFHRTLTKKVVSFSRKNRVTPSVAAPGDTKLSEATASGCCCCWWWWWRILIDDVLFHYEASSREPGLRAAQRRVARHSKVRHSIRTHIAQ